MGPELETIPNLQVIKALTSLKSRGYVKEQFAWRHYYWYLTNEGIQYLRDYLHLPSEIVPSTLKRALPRGDASQLGLLLPGPVVISPRETGPHTGRHLEVRTRPALLALDRRPWSSVEDLAVASLPSSSSVTYERNVIGCSAKK